MDARMYEHHETVDRVVAVSGLLEPIAPAVNIIAKVVCPVDEDILFSAGTYWLPILFLVKFVEGFHILRRCAQYALRVVNH